MTKTTPRRHSRFELFRKANWDFYAGGSGLKKGYISNISQNGCLLKTSESIEKNRWVRIMVQVTPDFYCSTVGRIVRRQHAMETVDNGQDFTLFDFGIEFTHPIHPHFEEASREEQSQIPAAEIIPLTALKS